MIDAVRIPPHDDRAEKSVLGLAIGGSDRGQPSGADFLAMANIVKADDFYTPAHAVLWRALGAMIDAGKPLELGALASHLRATKQMGAIGRAGGTDEDGAVYLTELVDGYSFSTANATHYATIVRDHALRRAKIIEHTRLAEEAWDPDCPVEPKCDNSIKPRFKTIRELVTDYPRLRPPVIHGLLREAETMNIIAPTKRCKSWLVGDLALALATGRLWMGQFPTERGDVLILDNELHRETTAYRIPKIAEARGIPRSEYGDHVCVDNLRGRLLNIHGLPAYLSGIEPGQFKVIVLDALYRFWPPEASENDNAAVAGFYNIIDSLAGRLNCCFVLIHHTSKGSQAGKSITDIGAGAGAISRAADCHLTLIAHEADTTKFPVVVLDAGPRTWPPVEPVCLRFAWPIWTPAPELDPTALKPDRPRRRKTETANETEPATPTDPTLEFAGKYISARPATRATILDAAMQDGLSENRGKKLLAAAEGRKLAFRWKSGSTLPVEFANVEQPKLNISEAAE
jgi:hypothetical protein